MGLMGGGWAPLVLVFVVLVEPCEGAELLVVVAVPVDAVVLLAVVLAPGLDPMLKADGKVTARDLKTSKFNPD